MFAIEQHITIPGKDFNLTATLHVPEVSAENQDQNQHYPLILICHGFVGDRIGANRLFVKAAREFSSNGFVVLRFDYAGCGESPGEYAAGGLDALIEQTLTAINYGYNLKDIDQKQIILIGHSLGGAVTLIAAAKDQRVTKLIMWSAVAHPFHDIVKIVGKKVYDSATREGSADYLGYSLTSEFFSSLASHQPFEYYKHFSGDVLLVHGTADEAVPVDYCFLYQKIFRLRTFGKCDKEVIFQADHTFSSSEHTLQLLHKTTEWLRVNATRRKEWFHWNI